MMHIAWCCLEEVPYCFSRSSVKFQGHTALKIVEFDLDWAFPDCNSSLNSPIATKWCKKLKVALKRCRIVFRVIHQISRSHGLKIGWFESNLSKITRPVAAIKSLRFALLPHHQNFYFTFQYFQTMLFYEFCFIENWIENYMSFFFSFSVVTEAQSCQHSETEGSYSRKWYVIFCVWIHEGKSLSNVQR